jgi:hypothetical protein
MAVPPRQVKRARTEDEDGASAPSTSTTAGYVQTADYHRILTDWTSRSLMNLQRWVWLEVAEPQPQAQYDYHYRPLPLNTTFNRHYVPEGIIAHIPTYQTQLNERLALIEGDTEPTIRDGVAHDSELVCKTIRFLASGYLTPVEEGQKESEETWDSLVKLYNFSRLLSIKTLELAMLKQFTSLIEALSPAVFLAFARRCYGRNRGSPHDTTLAQLIKLKLAWSLPLLQHTMSVKDISSQDGTLGMQLIEVLLEDRALKEHWPLVPADIDSDCFDRRWRCRRRMSASYAGRKQEAQYNGW